MASRAAAAALLALACAAEPTASSTDPAIVAVDWSAPAAATTTAIPTYLTPSGCCCLPRGSLTKKLRRYLDQVNPSMDRASPMHDAAFSRMDKLGAKLVRYLHWSSSQAPFAELEEGVFNFTKMDEYVLDFLACKNAPGSVMNFDAGPCWLHEGADCAKPLRDSTGKEYGEWISRIISWYTKGGFTDTRSGKKYTSPHRFKWENYEILVSVGFLCATYRFAAPGISTLTQTLRRTSQTSRSTWARRQACPPTSTTRRSTTAS